MSSYNTTGSITTNGSTFVVPITDQGRPGQPPAGLIATRAVHTKKGWRGQVIVDKEIVWEGGNVKSADAAIKAANKVVVSRLRGLFT